MPIISASLYINIASVSANNVDLSPSLSVGLSVRKVYCGKTTEWIRMPFGVVSGVSRSMGVRWWVVMVEGEGAVLG